MLKFPNSSYRPKQIYHNLLESDEFEQVIVIGIKKDQSFGFKYSTSDWVFLSAAATLITQIINFKIGITDEKT